MVMNKLIRRAGTHGADISFHDTGISLQATLLFLDDDGTTDTRMRVIGSVEFVKKKLSDHLDLWDSRASVGDYVAGFSRKEEMYEELESHE